MPSKAMELLRSITSARSISATWQTKLYKNKWFKMIGLNWLLVPLLYKDIRRKADPTSPKRFPTVHSLYTGLAKTVW
jgi:hypothetical protein